MNVLISYTLLFSYFYFLFFFNFTKLTNMAADNRNETVVMNTADYKAKDND